MEQKPSYHCSICNTDVSTEGNMKRHMESKHGYKKKFDCKDCNKQYPNKSNLIRHINSIHKQIKFKCDQCDKKFSSTSSKSYQISP